MTDTPDPNQPLSGADDSLQIAVLGHLLRNERGQTAATLDTLASLLQAAVPERVEIALGGRFWHKVRPVDKINISFDDSAIEISRSKSGAPAAVVSKIVGGITLKSSKTSMEDCIRDIVARLTKMESESAATRIALRKFAEGR